MTLLCTIKVRMVDYIMKVRMVDFALYNQGRFALLYVIKVRMVGSAL